MSYLCHSEWCTVIQTHRRGSLLCLAVCGWAEGPVTSHRRDTRLAAPGPVDCVPPVGTSRLLAGSAVEATPAPETGIPLPFPTPPHTPPGLLRPSENSVPSPARKCGASERCVTHRPKCCHVCPGFAGVGVQVDNPFHISVS